MGQVKFARVDARLIHGQVATAWSNSVGIDNIYVVDNATAQDDFMKMLYTNLQNNYSFGIKVLTVEEAAELWEKDQFGKDKVMLLFKTIDSAYKLAELGVPYDALNVGGVPQGANNKVVADAVAITQKEYDQLVTLSEEYNKEVYFQTLPSASKKKLSAVKY